MTKTPVREGPPLEFPPARLFLDDIEEIIRVFRESRKYVELPDAEPTIKIRWGDWECDSVEDLRGLGKAATKNFFVQVAIDWNQLGIFYLFGRSFAGWPHTSASDEGKWAVYGQLHAILKKRKSRWPPWRPSSRVIFENSYEYKSMRQTLQRHAAQIALVVATAVLTLLAQELLKILMRYL